MSGASKIRIVAASLALVLGSTTAGAEGGPRAGKNGGGQGACKQDRERLCPEARGGSEIFHCMKEHEDEISQTCREQIERRREHLEARLKSIQEACEEDVQRHCEQVEPGDRRVLQCLRQHESELSQACRDGLPPRQGKGRKGTPRTPSAPTAPVPQT